MSNLKVYDMSGKEVGNVNVDDSQLVLEKGSQAVRDVVVAILAGRRAGTASTLTKGSVAGSNKKPWQQKGLGRARAGYKQSPVWRGGGVAFGPHPRSYAQKVNRKVMALAFKRVLSDAISENRIKVLDKIDLPELKTKAFVGFMKSLSIANKALFIDSPVSSDLNRVSRNVPTVEVVDARNVNVYQLMKYRELVVTRAGMDVLKARLEGVRANNSLVMENIA